MHDFDYILAGGGLQSGLLTLALRQAQPAARIAIVERGEQLGGNHTWCFHAGDRPAGARFCDALVEHRWLGYEVVFPSGRRRVRSAYAGFSSAHFDRVVRAALRGAGEVLTGRRVTALDAASVTLDGGDRLRARAVIDARGPGGAAAPAGAGYQKFVGLELRTETPHGLSEPVLMDATVPQEDGFRFVYLLPFSRDRLLVEDTYFSDSPALDDERLAAGVLAYARERGLAVAEVVRRERGVLPMPWRGPDPEPPFSPLRAGYASGWFHPGTGYSFPVAARLAAAVPAAAPEDMGRAAAALARRHRRQARFARGLNRLLFRWFSPADRWHVLARFYRLPEPTIERFYALETTPADRARIALGRPPRGLSLRARLASA